VARIKGSASFLCKTNNAKQRLKMLIYRCEFSFTRFNYASSFDPSRLRRCSNSEYTKRSEQREKNHFRVNDLSMNEEIYE